MNTANKITIMRILLVPVLLVCMFSMEGSFGMTVLSAALFLFISFTDLLDGYIARKYNQITDLGKFLDPLADKILVISAMTVLVELHYMPAIAVIIIIIREFLVTSLRLVAVNSGVVIAASKWGKLKTILQMTAVIASLFYPFISPVIVHSIIWISVAITIISCVDYIIKNYTVMKTK